MRLRTQQVLAGVLLSSLAVGPALIATEARAAVISGDLTEIGDPDSDFTVDLTAEGTLDWATWQTEQPGDETAGLAPSDRKLSGGLISSVTQITTNGFALDTLASDAGAADFAFSWTDGTPTSIGSGEEGGLQSAMDEINVGEGFQIDIDLPTSQGTIKFYVGVRSKGGNVIGKLTVLQEGVELYDSEDESESLIRDNGSNGNNAGYYTLNWSDADIGESISLQFLAQQTGGFSYLRLFGATVGAVPEPASLTLLGIGGLLILPGRSRTLRAVSHD